MDEWSLSHWLNSLFQMFLSHVVGKKNLVLSAKDFRLTGPNIQEITILVRHGKHGVLASTSMFSGNENQKSVDLESINAENNTIKIIGLFLLFYFFLTRGQNTLWRFLGGHALCSKFKKLFCSWKQKEIVYFSNVCMEEIIGEKASGAKTGKRSDDVANGRQICLHVPATSGFDDQSITSERAICPLPSSGTKKLKTEMQKGSSNKLRKEDG